MLESVCWNWLAMQLSYPPGILAALSLEVPRRSFPPKRDARSFRFSCRRRAGSARFAPAGCERAEAVIAWTMAARRTILRVAAERVPQRPLLVFDGDCGFCRYWVERLRGATRETVDFEPSQKVAGDFPEIPQQDFDEAVQLIEPDGTVASGADAMFRALEVSGRFQGMIRGARAVPGIMAAAQAVYRVIARNRMLASFFTKILFGKDAQRPGYLVARRWFVCLLGLVFLVAFVSLWVQIRGLVGSLGILPAADTMLAARHSGADFWDFPTLCWLNASDGFLVFQCAAGAAISCVLIVGYAPGVCLALLWLLYLSLVTIGRVFLGYQWDALLLETGFLAIFLMPLQLRPDWTRETSGSRITRWLLLFLLFRLMFESGVVKLASGDKTWRNLTALTFHYETQPLPTWTAWFAFQAPLWFQKACCAATLAIELALPFAIIGPRNVRRAGGIGLIGLQVIIAATGNFGFFNLLAVSLCLLMLDDGFFPRRWRENLAVGAGGDGPRWWPWALVPVGAVSLTVSAIQLSRMFGLRVAWPEPVVAIYSAQSPFRICNSYGLFAVMTTRRHEIVVEGSDDGKNWRAYGFKWKPGPTDRRPRFTGPHMPRLDWQMWFAALGQLENNPWFGNFLVRLLEGSPDGLKLMAENPFPGQPPRYVRAVLYDYHFTRIGEVPGQWWHREKLGLYCPPVSLSTTTGEK